MNCVCYPYGYNGWIMQDPTVTVTLKNNMAPYDVDYKHEVRFILSYDNNGQPGDPIYDSKADNKYIQVGDSTTYSGLYPGGQLWVQGEYYTIAGHDINPLKVTVPSTDFCVEVLGSGVGSTNTFAYPCSS